MMKAIAQCKLNDKAEWIKFTVKSFYKWHKQIKIMQKQINRISMKVTVRENKIIKWKSVKDTHKKIMIITNKWITSKRNAK